MSPKMQAAILERFGHRHLTVDEVSKRTGYCFSRTSKAISKIRRAGGKIRIVRYEPPAGAGLWTPVYAIGTAPDAVMPDHNARARLKAGLPEPTPMIPQQTWLSALGVM